MIISLNIFDVLFGVKQGDNLSPTLFNLFNLLSYSKIFLSQNKTVFRQNRSMHLSYFLHFNNSEKKNLVIINMYFVPLLILRKRLITLI